MPGPENQGTPWPSERRSKATRKEAIPPEQVAKMPKGPPPAPGRLPGQGVPPEKGRDPAVGVPRDAGTPPEVGKPPGTEGQKPKGAPGQMLRGTPGQMDPWADNPWAPNGEAPEGWVPPAPLTDVDDGEAFYMNHPNFHNKLPEPKGSGDDEGSR